MRVSAIIAAAGSGIRLGLDAPKAFVPLGGRSLLYYSLRAIAALDAIGEAVVTVPAGMEQRARAEVERAGLEIPVKLVAGGAERQDSVRIALAITSAESDVVVVHDAAPGSNVEEPTTGRILRAAREQLFTHGYHALTFGHLVGEVVHSGATPLSPNMTVLQALSQAGFTQFANLKGIYLLRTENGKQEKIPFNYNEVTKGVHPEQNIKLMARDTLVVP